MASRRGRRRGGKNKSIPIGPVAPLVLVVANELSAHGLTQAGLNEVVARTIGIDSTGHYAFANHKAFVIGEIVGIIVHKAAGKLGVNKYVKKATMGFLTI